MPAAGREAGGLWPGLDDRGQALPLLGGELRRAPAAPVDLQARQIVDQELVQPGIHGRGADADPSGNRGDRLPAADGEQGAHALDHGQIAGSEGAPEHLLQLLAGVTANPYPDLGHRWLLVLI